MCVNRFFVLLPENTPVVDKLLSLTARSTAERSTKCETAQEYRSDPNRSEPHQIRVRSRTEARLI